MQLAGQTALVTGAASGMGAAVAAKLAACDMRVIGLDRQPCNGLDYAAQVDVADSAQVEAALNAAVAVIGVPRLIVNCAGIAPAARLLDRDGQPQPLAAFQHVIDVNLIGTFNVLRLAAAQLLSAPLLGEERGVIINTASIAAFEGQTGQAAYSAAKGGIVAMTLPLARELAQHAIRVMTIAPGLVDTPLMQSIPDRVITTLTESIPFPSRCVTPHEFAGLVQHIAEQPCLNGSVIRLDGALRMGK